MRDIYFVKREIYFVKRDIYKLDRGVYSINRTIYKMKREIYKMKREIYASDRGNNFRAASGFVNVSCDKFVNGCIAGKNKRQALFIKASALLF